MERLFPAVLNWGETGTYLLVNMKLGFTLRKMKPTWLICKTLGEAKAASPSYWTVNPSVLGQSGGNRHQKQF
jgi:hypothetical protein